jgi:hypothetical protein
MADVRATGGRPARPNPLDEILQSEPNEVPVVEVVGDFFERIRFVSSTAMAGLLGFAKLKDSETSILIPYVETRIEGGSPRDESETEFDAIFSGVMTLENAAFLVVNLASDMRSVCEELASLSGSTTQMERRRLEQARYLLAHTAREAIAATSKLTAILDNYPAANVISSR